MNDTEQADRERRKALVEPIWRAALAAVEPCAAVRKAMAIEGDTLLVAENRYDLRQYRRVIVVGAGKAAAPMARAVEEVMTGRPIEGIVAVKDGHTAPADRIAVIEAGHPIPDARGQAAAERMAKLVGAAGADDLVVCLVSGGASALLPLPVPGVALEDKQRVTNAMLNAGANITELNAVRKHLSAIKGGQLAAAATPATMIALILSDVVGNPLEVIGSGPTVGDSSTFQEAYDILARYELLETAPAAVLRLLRDGIAGIVKETPKPGAHELATVRNTIVGSNEIAAQAAVEKAKAEGWDALLLTTYLEGEAREVGRVCAAIAKEIVHSNRPVRRPGIVVAGGETTVTIRGRGLGGRNQELALSTAIALAGSPDVALLALATDGTDGPTDAAGAYVDGTTVARAQALGLDPRRFLAENDGYAFFTALGDLIVSGPTNTNVNDLLLMFGFALNRG